MYRYQMSFFPAILLFFSIFSLFPPIVGASTECNQISNSSAIPSGYGAPFNLFSNAKELLVRVTCETSGEVVHLGSGDTAQYIYNSGWEYRGSWQKVTYTGSQTSGVWFLGNAVASLAPLDKYSATPPIGYVLGYVCQNISGAWKCGCRDKACTSNYWQLQTFPKSTTYSSAQSEVDSQLAASDTLTLAFSGPYWGPVGTKISFTGSGFTPTGNTIHFGTNKIRNIPSLSTSRIDFVVPATISPGIYSIAIENSHGKTGFDTFFVLTNPGAVPPTISSINPSKVEYGGTVTIKGQNFRPTGNVVQSSYHVYENVPSTNNGTTITLPIEGWEGFQSNPSRKEFPTWVYIVNTNGVTPQNNPGTFTVGL